LPPEILAYTHGAAHPASPIDRRLELAQPHVEPADLVSEVGDGRVQLLLDDFKAAEDQSEADSIRILLVPVAKEDEDLPRDLATCHMGRYERAGDSKHDLRLLDRVERSHLRT
jgi:hypothetical protein